MRSRTATRWMWLSSSSTSVALAAAAMALSACSAGGDSKATPDRQFAPDAGGADSSVPAASADGAAEDSSPVAEVGFNPDVGQGAICEVGVGSTVSGTVYSPAKVDPDPLYNAIVFIPKEAPAPFKPGASCDRCGTLEGAKAISVALTGADGKFVLKGVPPGENVPLVIQIGRWRRQVVIPRVAPCTDTPLPAELTRLPRSKAEGDIPLTAIATGGADSLECVIRKMGIDDAEFTDPTRDGRIHMFKAKDGAELETGSFDAESFWANPVKLKRYDLVLLPCEGIEYLGNKSPDARQAMVEYTATGGRVFATHYSYVWLHDAPAESKWAQMVNWRIGKGSFASTLHGYIDMTFPKGKAMAEWLKNVGASSTLGEINIKEPRLDVDSTAAAQAWITSKEPTPSLQHFTFNTPVAAKTEDQCGRVVFSNFHVVGSGGFGAKRFPRNCNTSPLTPQEKVIEFMLFDLASCVQKDDQKPKLPT